jgi:hypothetical protein
MMSQGLSQRLVLSWESKSINARWLQRRLRAASVEGHLGEFLGTRMHTNYRQDDQFVAKRQPLQQSKPTTSVPYRRTSDEPGSVRDEICPSPVDR